MKYVRYQIILMTKFNVVLTLAGPLLPPSTLLWSPFMFTLYYYHFLSWPSPHKTTHLMNFKYTIPKHTIETNPYQLIKICHLKCNFPFLCTLNQLILSLAFSFQLHFIIIQQKFQELFHSLLLFHKVFLEKIFAS